MQTQKDKIAEAAKFESKIDDTSRQDKLLKATRRPKRWNTVKP